LCRSVVPLKADLVAYDEWQEEQERQTGNVIRDAIEKSRARLVR
jgi:hypothetical protein